MKFRAVVKKSGDWWIGAEDMLAMEVPFEADAQMTTVMVKDAAWAESQAN